MKKKNYKTRLVKGIKSFLKNKRNESSDVAKKGTEIFKMTIKILQVRKMSK